MNKIFSLRNISLLASILILFIFIFNINYMNYSKYTEQEDIPEVIPEPLPSSPEQYQNLTTKSGLKEMIVNIIPLTALIMLIVVILRIYT